MTRIAIAIAILALVAAGTAIAAGGGVSATGGSHLTAYNVFGLQTLELQHFSFNARAQADGTADGWFDYRDVEDGAPFDASGPVWCMTVIGNEAWIGATIESSNDPSVVGQGGWWHVVDNGEGSGDPPDVTSFLGVGNAQQTQAFCDNHPAFRFAFPIDGGNIQVRG
jgi:hypothetical protein